MRVHFSKDKKHGTVFVFLEDVEEVSIQLANGKDVWKACNRAIQRLESVIATLKERAADRRSENNDI